MIYISTYLKLLTLDEEKKNLYADFFEVEVEDLKRISPARWNKEISGTKFEDYRQRIALKHYKSYENTSKKYKEGKITGKDLKDLQLTYSEWLSRQKSGIYNIIGDSGEPAKNSHFEFLRKPYDKKNLTDKYNKYFDTKSTKIKSELEIYEYDNSVYIFQNIFEMDHVNKEHLILNGLFNSVPESLLYKEGLSYNGKMWGSKEWVIEQVKAHGYEIEKIELYEKEFNSSLMIHLPISGTSVLVFTGFIPALGPINFKLGDYKQVFNNKEKNKDNKVNLPSFKASKEFVSMRAENTLPLQYEREFQYNYDLWCSKGRHDIMDYLIREVPQGNTSAYPSFWGLMDGFYTERYKQCFERKLDANVAPIATYECDVVKRIDILQRIFITDYYNMFHMQKEGLWNNGEMKYLYSDHLALNGVRFAGKDWIEECCRQNMISTKIFKNKTINFHILLVFGQSGETTIIGPEAIGSMRDIRFY